MKQEPCLDLPSQELMTFQWQYMGDLFEDISWTIKPKGMEQIFTVYCLN